MLSRRNLLKSLGVSALSLSALPSFSNSWSDTTPLADPQDPAFWKSVRDQFMLSKDSIFFNTGTVGVMPKAVVDKMVEHTHMMATHVADWAYKDDNKEQFISGYNNLLPIRTKVAKLLNCEVGEIAMTDNVTNGMSYIANGPGVVSPRRIRLRGWHACFISQSCDQRNQLQPNRRHSGNGSGQTGLRVHRTVELLQLHRAIGWRCLHRWT